MTDMNAEAEIVEQRAKNKDDLYFDYHCGKQREYLRSLICDELIEEHKRKPLGQHSEPLARMLFYFRSLPLSEQIVLKKNSDDGSYELVTLSGERGVPPIRIDDTRYSDLDEAYHGIFLKHLEKLSEN